MQIEGSEEIRAGMLELGIAITALRTVSPFRGSKARNFEAFGSARQSMDLAQARLKPALVARGQEPPVMVVDISDSGWGSAMDWPRSLQQRYALRDLRSELSGVLASLGEPVPDDLPDPGFFERHLEAVPRPMLPFVPWMPMVLGWTIATAVLLSLF